MKKLLYLLLILSGYSVSAQTIKHNSYTTYYDSKIGEPDSVHWLLTPSMGKCSKKLPRLNKFVSDPKIPNTKFNIFYQGSGYDQGHQFDADDASCSVIDETECWYFSNMVPQCPNLNRITWRALENYTRKLATKVNVNVTCGVIGTLRNMVGIDSKKVKHPSNISIPKYCWKRLSYGNTVEYYIMPNMDTVKNHPFTYYKK